MIEKTEAIPLIWHEVSNTSRIVHWFTRAHGRVATMIKGAVRPKSAFHGQYDLHATSELLFYSRERDELHIAKECALLTPRMRMRGDWRAHVAASSLASLLLRCSPPLAAAPALFADYTIALDALEKGLSPPMTQHWAELRLCAELGIQPRLAGACCACDGPLGREDALGFSPPRGGLVCARCLEDGDSGHKISGAAVALLRRLQQAASPDTLSSLRTHTGQDRELHVLLGRFLSYHLDFPQTARDIAWSALAAAHRA